MKQLNLNILFIFFMSLILTLFFCSKTDKKITNYTLKEYSAKLKFGDVVKDSLKTSFSIGFFESGSQKYFVGITGYSSNDTTLYLDKKNSIKKDGNKTFHYDEKGDIFLVAVENADTTWLFEGKNEKEPISFLISDKNRKIFEECDLKYGVIKTYKNRKFDDSGNLTFSIVEIGYYPTKFDLEHYSEYEINKKVKKQRDIIIREIEYNYY